MTKTLSTSAIDKVAPIRHMNFNFDPSKASKYPWNNNAWGSAFILTFSAVIPAGEKMVIEAVRNYRDQIEDPVLKAEVTSLIGQEAIHSRAHAEFNNIYDLKGLPVNAMARLADTIYMDYLVPQVSKKTLLAMACAVEHVTAMMAEKAFGDELDFNEHYDEITADFLGWHLLEELEHKSIAFDLYEAVDGSYSRRVAAFLLVWGVSIPVGLYVLNQIMSTPSYSQGKKANRQGIGFYSKFFLSISPKLATYFRKDFHPNNSDTSALLHEWRDKYFGKHGKLNNRVTKSVLPRLRKAKKQRAAATA